MLSDAVSAGREGLIMKASALNGYPSGVGDNSHDGFGYNMMGPVFTDHNKFTMFFLVKITGVGFSAWASVSEASGDTTWRLGHESDMTLEVQKTFAATANTANMITTGWHYVVHVQNGSVASTWVDGTQFTWSPNPGAATLTPTIYHFGSGWYQVFGGYPRFTGEIAEFALYDKAITDLERTTNLENYARQRYGLA